MENKNMCIPVKSLMDIWKDNALIWHIQVLSEYNKDKCTLIKLMQEKPGTEELKAFHAYFDEACNGLYEINVIEEADPETSKVSVYKIKNKVSTGKYEPVKKYFDIDSYRLSQLITDDLNYVYDARYKDIVDKIESITGEITSTDNCSVTPDGVISGFIEGKLGTVKIMSYMVGGYNKNNLHTRLVIEKFNEVNDV